MARGRGEGTYALVVPATTAPNQQTIITAACRLMGWSLAGGDVAGQSNTGTVTSPAAGAVIATLASVPPGEYSVEWIVSLSGTLGAPEVNNFGLYVAGVLQATSVNPSVAGNYLQDNVQVSIPAGGASVQVKAIVLGTVAAVYGATEVVTGGPGMQATLLDSAGAIGQSAAVPSATDTQILSDDGIYISTSIAVKVTAGTCSGVIYVRDMDYSWRDVNPGPG